jgi:hypothetical protein
MQKIIAINGDSTAISWYREDRFFENCHSDVTVADLGDIDPIKQLI